MGGIICMMRQSSKCEGHDPNLTGLKLKNELCWTFLVLMIPQNGVSLEDVLSSQLRVVVYYEVFT